MNHKEIGDAIKEVCEFAIAEGKLLCSEDYKSSALNILYSAHVELIMRFSPKKRALEMLNSLHDVGKKIVEDALKMELVK